MSIVKKTHPAKRSCSAGRSGKPTLAASIISDLRYRELLARPPPSGNNLPSPWLTGRGLSCRPVAGHQGVSSMSYTPDILAAGLDVIFCGINPATTAAASGHNFSNSNNRFWKVLHLAGFTDTRLE